MGGGGGEGRGGGYYSERYTVTDIMIFALRWAALGAVLMFHSLRGGEITGPCPQITVVQER